MPQDKYVAYVSTYTMGNDNKYGIKIFDVDMKNGYLTERDKVEITNPSYITISHNHKILYSITDFGVEAYRIEKDGSLFHLNNDDNQEYNPFELHLHIQVINFHDYP